ncbi:MAG TPA: 3'-5' exonuclease [Candidatus Wallbacteria bacterium]|nr:3'-5' exonuclease [Candidatus Wallbacteria bacterium]
MITDEEIIKKRKNLGKEKHSLDSLYNILKTERQDGVSAEFIVETIMKMKGVKGPLSIKMAETHIGDDPRFRFANGICRLKEAPRGAELFNAPSYCAVDIETTGLSPKNDAIIEIAAVKIVDNQICGTFSTLVNPGVPISEEITKINGITDAMVENAPAIDEVMPEFLDFLGDSVLVAHNAAFDISFINEALYRKYYQKMINPIICTLKLAKMLYPNFESHSLGSVAQKLKISMTAHHRALSDADACAKMLVNFLKVIKSGANKN